MEEQGHLVTFESLLLSSRFAFACGRNDSPILRTTVSKEGSEVNCAFKYPSVHNICQRKPTGPQSRSTSFELSLGVKSSPFHS